MLQRTLTAIKTDVVMEWKTEIKKPVVLALRCRAAPVEIFRLLKVILSNGLIAPQLQTILK